MRSSTAAQGARLLTRALAGPRIVAVDTAGERRKLAQQFGAHEVLDPAEGDVVAAIRDLTHGEGAHKTVPAVAARTIDHRAFQAHLQVTLVGSWTFSKQGQAECAEFVAERRVDVERLFTHRWKLEEAEEAYRLFDKQTTGKAVILPF
jgi:threonine dehydrogenase-like Zn-dependent dehydrogenase